MDENKIKEAAKSIQYLEEFLLNIERNIDQKIEDKFKSISQNTPNDLKTIDERVNYNLANALQRLLLALNNPNTETQNIDGFVKREPPSQPQQLNSTIDLKQDKTRQYEIAVSILKGHKRAMKIREVARILENTHGIKWSNPTAEFYQIVKKYPIKKVTFGEYKYVGEE